MPNPDDRSVQCWEKGCEATIPDTEFETMQKHGWGFLMDYDPAMPVGIPGYYYACLEHKWKD